MSTRNMSRQFAVFGFIKRATILMVLCCWNLEANAVTFTVTNTANAGAGSLRQAILDSNANILALTCVPTAPFNTPGGFIFLNAGSTLVKNVQGMAAFASIAAARTAIAAGVYPPSPSGLTNSMLLWDANNSATHSGVRLYPSLLREFPIEVPVANASNYATGAFGKFTVDSDANGNGIAGESILVTFGMFSDDRSQLLIIGQDFTLPINATLQNLSGDDALTADVLSSNTNSYGLVTLTEGATYDFEAYHTENGGTSDLEIFYALGDTRSCFSRETAFPLVEAMFRCVGPIVTSSRDTIEFNIAAPGVQVISPTSALPTILDSVLIDGFSQPGAMAGNLLIEIAGNAAGAAHGLNLLTNAGGSEIRGLVVNRFSAHGIFASNISFNSFHSILDNISGLDATGTIDRGNGSDGIRMETGCNLIEANLSSGNAVTGINIPFAAGLKSTIRQNFSGTNAAGTAGIANGAHGIDVRGTESLVELNLSSGNGQDGIVLASVNSITVRENKIGVNLAGTAAVSNGRDGVTLVTTSFNLIDNNLISGNIRNGVVTASSSLSNVVSNNKIGTDITGTLDLGNGQDGILFQTASQTASRNILSGNGRFGIRLSGSNLHVISGNFIGTDATGTLNIGNSNNGVDLTNSSENVIGKSLAGGGNVIAFNIGAAINLDSNSVRSAFLENLIYSNNELGIDLQGDNNITVNDPFDLDTGSNNLQNYPVILDAHRSTTDSNLVTIEGTLNSFPSTSYLIQLFINTAPDPSDFGEGQFYVGEVSVTTDASGVATFAQDIEPVGNFVTATATRKLAGVPVETSEFSLNFELDLIAPVVTIITPPNGAIYSQDQIVLANYFCTDEINGSGIASCQGNVANGFAIDTSSPGIFSFTVIGIDNFGNATSLTHTYTVVQKVFGGGSGGSSRVPSDGDIGDDWNLPPLLDIEDDVLEIPPVVTPPKRVPLVNADPSSASQAPSPEIIPIKPESEDAQAVGCQTTKNTNSPGLGLLLLLVWFLYRVTASRLI